MQQISFHNNHNINCKSFGYSKPTCYQTYEPYNPYESQKRQSTDNEAVDTAGKVIFLQAVTFGLNKLSKYFSNKLLSGEEFTSSENIINTAKEMVRKNNLNVKVNFVDESNKNILSAIYGGANEFNEVAKGRNAFYIDEAKLAVAPKSKPSMILHELGHAINAKGKFTKLLQKSRRYAMYAPTALLIANKLTKNPNSKEQSFVEKHATALGFCAFLPTIIEEGLASFRGIKAAKEKLGNIANLSILKKNYAIALCTYIISGIGLGIAAKQTIDSNY